MQKSEPRPTQIDWERIKAYVDDAVAAGVANETRALKMQINTALDTMSFMEKQFNLRLGALLGHETRKKQKDDVVFETSDISEAVAVVENLKKKVGAAGSKPAA